MNPHQRGDHFEARSTRLVIYYTIIETTSKAKGCVKSPASL